MSASPNDKELTTLGFITPKLRTGLVTAIMAMLITWNIVLFRKLSAAEEEKQQMQKELYEKIINYIKPPLDHINQTASKVDSVASTIQTKGTQP